MNTKIFIAIAIIIVLGLGYAYIGKNKGEDDDSMGQQVLDNGASTMMVGENALYAGDQKPGKTMKIPLVHLEKSGFVVIHEISEAKPGKILGSSALLPAIESTKVPVALSAQLVEGKRYMAMLHADDGDGKFNAATDSPIRDPQGNIIMMEFMVSKDAEQGSEISI